jgi:phosphomannomutase
MATTAPAASVIPALTDRPVKNTICLFDVDGTLTPARRVSTAQATTAVP